MSRSNSAAILCSMALTTAHLPDLRERSNNIIGEKQKVQQEIQTRLESLEADAKLPAKDQRALRSAKSAEIKAWVERYNLEKVASTAEQRIGYGIEEWNRDFIRLSQIEAPPDSKFSIQKLRTRVWNALPNGKFKRFQEVFSDPHNFVVPQLVITPSGQIHFPGVEDLKNLSVKGCLVSVDRIPDELAESLQLITFEGKERRCPSRRLFAKAHSGIIDRLKQIWDAALPVSSSDDRALLVQRPNKEVSERYPQLKGFPTGIHGAILYTRENEGERIQRKKPLLGPEEVRPLMVQLFPTIFAAYRRTLHVFKGYREEQQRLVEFSERISQTVDTLASRWRVSPDNQTKAELRKELRQTVDDVTIELRKVRNRYKIIVADLLTKVREGKDSLDRDNPLVTCTCLSAAARGLHKRFSETVFQSSFNERDRAHLKARIQADGWVLQQTREKLLENGGSIIASHPVFKTGLTPEARERLVGQALDKIVPYRNMLEKVQIRPFCTYAELLRIGLQELKQGLLDADVTTSQQAIVKLHIITKFSAINVILETMKEQIVTSDRVAIDPLDQSLDKLKNVLLKRILPEVHVPEYEERYKSLLNRITPIRESLRQIRERRDTLGKGTPVMKELKKLLEDVSPEQVARELVPESWKEKLSS